MVKDHPETLERILIVGMLLSLHFYRALRNKVCVFLPELNCFRPDFTNPIFNEAFVALDAFYRVFENFAMPNDTGVPPQHLENILYDKVRNGLVTADNAVLIKEQLLIEMDTLEFTPEIFMAIQDCPAFHYWIERKAAEYEVRQLSKQGAIYPTTLHDLEQAVERTRKSLAPIKDRIIDLDPFFEGHKKWTPPLSTGLAFLDQALSGGLYPGETTMVAGSNGSGKTVMAVQIAMTMAQQGAKVAFFTTEESGDRLFMRMLSNFTNTEYVKLINREDAGGKSADVLHVPACISSDPEKAVKLAQLRETCRNIKFLDWTAGLSIAGQFEGDIRRLQDTGFDPRIIVFDWIGGGLDQGMDLEKRRFNYEIAVNQIVRFCKATGKTAVLMAQLDKTKLRPSTHYVPMSFLSECKTMTNQIDNFIGITALQVNDETGGKPRLAQRQFLSVDKGRYGKGGSVAVEQQFKFQRFVPSGPRLWQN